jgi:flagellar hook-associated protein 1 FlgK
VAPTVRANSNNAVTSQQPAVAISAIGNLTTSDYRLTYDGANYILSRISDGQNWTSATLATLPWPIDGITLTAGTWVPVAGDSFLIQPTRSAAANLALALTDSRAIAIAAPIRTGTALANSGTASIDAGSVTSVASLPLGGTVTLTYDGTLNRFVVTGPIAAGPFAYTSGAPISFAGMTVTITGTPADGDSFTIGNNVGGVADSRNGVLLGSLQTRSTIAGGTATYQSAYSTLVAEVGNKARQVEITGQAQQSLAEQAQTARDQVSGVNLDEEATNLMRYQQAYQAAAKMLDIASKLFDEVLALGR